MRSLLLIRRLSKHLPRKTPALVARHLGGARFLSETPLCHFVGAERCGSGDNGRLMIYDYTPSSPGTIVLEKTVPMDLMTETGTIGASYGWIATLKDGVVCLQDDLNPSASDSEPKRISLPPLATLPHCQTQLVTNVAMSSSSPDEDEDCILAVKFLGSQLSLCRPALKDKSEWVNIRIQDPGFFSSRVMYSKRDKMFSMPGSGGNYTGSWDLGEHRHKPKLQKWYFFNLPEFVQTGWAALDSCCTSEHLVESRAKGEMFMVKRFRTRMSKKVGRVEEKQIMVFRLEEKGLALFTKDIGDLSIFLSKSEPFCLQASLYDEREYSSVSFIDNNECGIFHLEDKFKHSFFSTYQAPYFVPPQSYIDANNGFASKVDSP